MNQRRALVSVVLLCATSVLLVPIACAAEDTTGSLAGSVTGVSGEETPEEPSPGDGVEDEAPPDISEELAVQTDVPEGWVPHEYRGVTVHAPAGQLPSGYADEEVDIAIHPLADDTAPVGGEIEVWTLIEAAASPGALLEGADCSLSGTDLAFGGADQSESVELDRRPVTFRGHEAVFCEGGGSGEHRLVVIAAIDEEPAHSMVRVAARAPTREEAEVLLATALSGVTFG